MPVLTRDAADQALTRLSTAHDKAGAALYGIDSHRSLGFLRAGPISGETARCWGRLGPEIDRSWARYTCLGDLLEQVRALRNGGRDDWDELARLLREPVVALDAAGVPTDGADVAKRIGVNELASTLTRGCADAARLLSEVDASWTAVSAALAPPTQRLEQLREAAADIALSLTEVTTRLATLRQNSLGDPLTAAPGGILTGSVSSALAAIDAALTALDTQVVELTRLRDGYPLRRTALLALIDEVEAAEREVAAAYDEALAKVSDPGLPPVPDSADVLRARVAPLDELAKERAWRRLADAVATLSATARRARERAHELRAAAAGLLGRREELRGRLDAYRVKASAYALDENETLAPLYATASTLLYTAPCDLRAATRAVYAYQQALTRLAEKAGRREYPS